MSEPASNFQNPVVWDGVSGNSLAGPWTEYMWLVIVGAIVAFAMAWGIGANDVANAFGTAVGAKTLTLWQACLIAAVFEFSGAIALGDEVTKTVAGSIADPADFGNVPEVFAYGMLCALIAAWLWITTATYLELAVSTTHSIIGAVLGFALVFGGGGAINWGGRSDTFPYVSGLVPVVISWFTSPILAGLLSALFFLGTRTLILRREHAHIIAFWALPPLVACTVFIGVFFVLIKGSGEEATGSLARSAWISGAAGGGMGLACTPLLVWLHRRQTTRQDRIQDAVDITPEVATSAKDWQTNTEPPTYWARIKARILFSLTFDVHQDVHRDLRVATMHSAAEVFDPRAEEVFKYLQVFSSCCVSFAHGANDVANAVGPFAAIWYVYQTHAVASSVPVPQWILALGGAGIVVGLATYGYNIIKVLGVKMAKMTPSRGYCAEIATALTVAVASLFGLPVSTTHAIVGAEVGVGMMEGVKQGTNYQLLAKTICAWVVTLAIAGLVSAAIFAFGIHTPNVTNLDAAVTYESIIIQTSIRLVQQLNATNYANQATIGRFDPVLNQSLAIAMANLTQLSKPGVINMDLLDAVSNATAWIYATQTVPTVGFKRNETYNTSTAITVPGW